MPETASWAHLVLLTESSALLVRAVDDGLVTYRAPGLPVGDGETPGHTAERVARELLGVEVTLDGLLFAGTERGVEHFIFAAEDPGKAVAADGAVRIRLAAALGYHVEPEPLGRILAARRTPAREAPRTGGSWADQQPITARIRLASPRTEAFSVAVIGGEKASTWATNTLIGVHARDMWFARRETSANSRSASRRPRTRRRRGVWMLGSAPTLPASASICSRAPRILIENVLELVLPRVSAAVQVTVLAPIGKVEPEARTQVTGRIPSTASSADAVYVTTAPAGPVASRVIGPGTVMSTHRAVPGRRRRPGCS